MRDRLMFGYDPEDKSGVLPVEFLTFTNINKCLYSYDGIHWEVTDSPIVSSESLWHPTACNGFRFVVTTGRCLDRNNVEYPGEYSTNVAAYSDDGINWTNTILPVSANWFGAATNGSRFVFISGKCQIASPGSTVAVYSDDGVNWIQSVLPIAHKWLDVGANDVGFVAIGQQGTGTAATNIAGFSPDGINWQQVLLPETTIWKKVVSHNNRFIIVPAYPGHLFGAYSDDGINWSQCSLPNMGVTWYGAASNGTNVVFLPVSSYVAGGAYSGDGINWVQTSIVSVGGWPTLVGNREIFTAFNGSTLGVDGIYSYDGINWSEFTVPSELGSRWIYRNSVSRKLIF